LKVICGFIPGSLQEHVRALQGPRTKSQQGLAARAPPMVPARSRQLGGTGAAPALSNRHLAGDRDGPRLGWDMSPWMGPTWWIPRQGREDRDGLRPVLSVPTAHQGLSPVLQRDRTPSVMPVLS